MGGYSGRMTADKFLEILGIERQGDPDIFDIGIEILINHGGLTCPMVSQLTVITRTEGSHGGDVAVGFSVTTGENQV
eukprot:543119-Amorphochlora_amoeboformis.AAC.1